MTFRSSSPPSFLECRACSRGSTHPSQPQSRTRGKDNAAVAIFALREPLTRILCSGLAKKLFNKAFLASTKAIRSGKKPPGALSQA